MTKMVHIIIGVINFVTSHTLSFPNMFHIYTLPVFTLTGRYGPHYLQSIGPKASYSTVKGYLVSPFVGYLPKSWVCDPYQSKQILNDMFKSQDPSLR